MFVPLRCFLLHRKKPVRQRMEKRLPLRRASGNQGPEASLPELRIGSGRERVLPRASIYDGAAPTEAPADNPAGMNVAQASGLPAPGQNGAASSTRTDVDTSGSGQARIGNEKAEQSSAEAADDPIRQTLDELRNYGSSRVLALSCDGASERPVRGRNATACLLLRPPIPASLSSR